MNKGRSKRLIALRNKKLIRRYHYWTEVKRRRFDDVLRILSQEEFFITESRIVRLLTENGDLFDDLVDADKDKKQLTLQFD